MTAAEFEARIVSWARARRDVAALVLIGSRAQAGAEVDEWSDWDFHVITRDPRKFLPPVWLPAIAPCWCAHVDRTERGVEKLSVVFAEGREADFVLLQSWKMKLVCWAMRHPRLARAYPEPLLAGVRNLRLIAGPGHRVLLGGRDWEDRYAALQVPWPEPGFSEERFQRCQSAFWRHAVWIFKKTARGELRAAARWHARELADALYLVLAEEARLAGRVPRPEARKAEQWLDPERLRQTATFAGGDARSQAAALLGAIDVFRAAVDTVAAARGFPAPPYAEVEQWLRGELAKVGE